MAERYIIDSNNLAYRSHLVKMDLKTSRGLPSGMFYNYIRSLMSLKKENRSYTFHVIWDGRAVKKYEIQPDYKAGRSKLPRDVWAQTDDIKTLLKNCGVYQYYNPEEEADDLIASLSKKFKNEGDISVILTNDKDMLQLVEDGKVIVHKPKVGLSPEKFFDEEAVEELFGVKPALVPYFRSFDGDSSDNIMGVPRVKRKKIAAMVEKYGSIDEIYKNIESEKLTEKEKLAFERAKDRILNNIKIIRLNKDIPVNETEEPGFNVDIVSGLIDKYEIKTIDPQGLVDLFSSTLSKKYTDAGKVNYILEDNSLF